MARPQLAAQGRPARVRLLHLPGGTVPFSSYSGTEFRFQAPDARQHAPRAGAPGKTPRTRLGVFDAAGALSPLPLRPPHGQRPEILMNLQEAHYQRGVDYRRGSPHLSHLGLHDRLVEILRRAVRRIADEGLPLRVLEVGAGHGGFTESALALGCAVAAVGMSGPAVEELRRRFGTNPRLEAIYDPDGTLDGIGDDYSLLMFVSVLHHIPDYL